MKKLITSSLMAFFFVIGMAGISSAIPVTTETHADSVFWSPGLQRRQTMFWGTHSVYKQGNGLPFDLGRIFNLNNYIIQIDDNRVKTWFYRDLSLPGSSYPAWELPNDETHFIRMLILPESYDSTGDSSSGNATVADPLSADSTITSLAFIIQEDGSPVPEPATMFLFGIGLTGLSRIRSRRNLA